jgi:hypothetical protein
VHQFKLDGDRIEMIAYGFSLSDARRIGNAVKAIETDGGLGHGESIGKHLFVPVLEVWVAGRRWPRYVDGVMQWTGTQSDYLKVPFDGVTQPSFVSAATWATLDFDNVPADGDARNDAAYIQISRTPGPVHYIHRA